MKEERELFPDASRPEYEAFMQGVDLYKASEMIREVVFGITDPTKTPINVDAFIDVRTAELRLEEGEDPEREGSVVGLRDGEEVYCQPLWKVRACLKTALPVEGGGRCVLVPKIVTASNWSPLESHILILTPEQYELFGPKEKTT